MDEQDAAGVFTRTRAESTWCMHMLRSGCTERTAALPALCCCLCAALRELMQGNGYDADDMERCGSITQLEMFLQDYPRVGDVPHAGAHAVVVQHSARCDGQMTYSCSAASLAADAGTASLPSAHGAAAD
jgi:hypothetical protein